MAHAPPNLMMHPHPHSQVSQGPPHAAAAGVAGLAQASVPAQPTETTSPLSALPAMFNGVVSSLYLLYIEYTFFS